MLKEKIQQQFEKYPGLQVLFHFDPEGIYEDKIDQVQLEGIRVVKYTRNDFSLKVKLNSTWSKEKIFLYFKQKPPREQEEYKAFALLDLLVANKELMLDVLPTSWTNTV